MNIFRFLNVGQGLFYSGRVCALIDSLDLKYYRYRYIGNRLSFLDTHIIKSNIRFVYDCGSVSKNHDEYIKKAIVNDFYPNEKVDIVFISHLHDDHINGLEELNKYVNVEKLILPYLYNDPVILFTYLAAISDYDLIIYDYELFIEKYNYYSNLYSRDFEQNKSHEIDITDWITLSGDNENYEYHSKSISYLGWKFFLINKRINIEIIDNIKKDIKTLIGSYEIVEIINYIKMGKANIDSIKSIYEKHIGKSKMNLSSTVVLHHPMNDLSEVSCLTGDAEFDSTMINICNDYLKENSIAYLQIPHHGSYNNWNKMKTLKDNAINLFVSFGLGNSYGHPSSKMLEEIHLSGRPLYSSVQSMMFLFPWNEYFIN